MTRHLSVSRTGCGKSDTIFADAGKRLKSGGRKPGPLLGIFLTVLIDMLGFGMFIPDLQLRGVELGATGVYLGLTIGVFSLAQLITAPILGRLSDRIGRRKILLLTTLLSAGSYMVYAHATALPMLVTSRVLSGIAAANLGVAFAYIADVTSPQQRAKGMGMVGAAFGLGFIFGPPLGAALVTGSGNSPLLLGYVAAGLAVLNLVYVLLLLPESLEAGGHGHYPSFVDNMRTAMRAPGMPILLAMFFALNFGFVNLESTFFQLLADQRSIFSLGDERARVVGAVILTFVGVIAAFHQGFLIRIFVKRYGEVKILRFAYLALAPALALTPFAPLWVPALIVMLVMGTANGLAQPSLSSLISRTAPATIQGSIFGVTQALGAVARFTSPLISNSLFKHVQPWAPYLLGAAIILFPAFAAWTLRQPEHHEEPIASEAVGA